MGVTKVANNKNNLIKGSLTSQKLQNTKGYSESSEFSPALGLTRCSVEHCTLHADGSWLNELGWSQ